MNREILPTWVSQMEKAEAPELEAQVRRMCLSIRLRFGYQEAMSQ